MNLCREIGSEIHWDRKNRVVEISTKGIENLLCASALLRIEPHSNPDDRRAFGAHR